MQVKDQITKVTITFTYEEAEKIFTDFILLMTYKGPFDDPILKFRKDSKKFIKSLDEYLNT